LTLLNKQLIKRSCVKIFHIIYINTYSWNVECNNFYKKIIIFILIAMLFFYYAVSFPLLCKKSFIIKNFCRFIDNIIQACVTASLDTKLQHYISYYFLFCRSALWVRTLSILKTFNVLRCVAVLMQCLLLINFSISVRFT